MVRMDRSAKSIRDGLEFCNRNIDFHLINSVNEIFSIL